MTSVLQRALQHSARPSRRALSSTSSILQRQYSVFSHHVKSRAVLAVAPLATRTGTLPLRQEECGRARQTLQTSAGLWARKKKKYPKASSSAKSSQGKGSSHTAFTMQDVAKFLPDGRQLFTNVNLSFLYGAKIGVLGLNGSGKSSLLRIVAGEDDQFTGTMQVIKGFSLGYFAQEPRLDEAGTVWDNIISVYGDKVDMVHQYDDAIAALETAEDDDTITALADKIADLEERINQAGAWNLEEDARMAAIALRCPPDDQEVSELSGGEKRRVALCKLLLSRPDILLLDEPTNHLDAFSVKWLEQFLKRYKGTVLAVTHDRYFLDNVAGYILELDRGMLYPYEGNYTDWLAKRQERLEQEGKVAEKEKKFLARELDWIRSNSSAKVAKQKKRLASYEELRKKSKSAKFESGRIIIPTGPRLGDQVISLKDVSLAYGDRVLLDKVTFDIPRGGIVGIIGPNGAGKTTLFNIIAGELVPDQGRVDIGQTVRMGIVEQSRATLNDHSSVWEEIADGDHSITLDGQSFPIRAYVAQFNFKGAAQDKLIGQLSGGERNRVHTAKLLKQRHNVLLLDEPTNDLDIETLRSLEEALPEFPGTAVVISHDRWFLDRICTHIVAFEGEGKVHLHEGNWESYEADRKKRGLTADVDRPMNLRGIQRLT